MRFIGGGLAPFAAGQLAEHYNVHVPFVIGACAILVGIAILATGHRDLARAESNQAQLDAHAGQGERDAELAEAAEAATGTPS